MSKFLYIFLNQAPILIFNSPIWIKILSNQTLKSKIKTYQINPIFIIKINSMTSSSTQIAISFMIQNNSKIKKFSITKIQRNKKGVEIYFQKNTPKLICSYLLNALIALHNPIILMSPKVFVIYTRHLEIMSKINYKRANIICHQSTTINRQE